MGAWNPLPHAPAYPWSAVSKSKLRRGGRAENGVGGGKGAVVCVID
jgi:hypothetical protein